MAWVRAALLKPPAVSVRADAAPAALGLRRLGWPPSMTIVLHNGQHSRCGWPGAPRTTAHDHGRRWPVTGSAIDPPKATTAVVAHVAHVPHPTIWPLTSHNEL